MNTQKPNIGVQMRMMLLKGEVQRVDSNYRGLRIRSGQAWVTVNGRDLVLKRDDAITLAGWHDAAVVSPLGHVPLVIELLGEAPRRPTVDPRLVVNTR